jgi:hypothetical protein
MTHDTESDSEPSTDTEYTQGDFAIGDHVRDLDSDTDGDPVVVNLPPVPIDEWDAYRTDEGAVTVADDNPAYAADSEVVVVMFDEDLDAWGGDWDGSAPLPLAEAPHDATYAFPPGRLEPTGATYGAADTHDTEAREPREEGDDTEARADPEDSEATDDSEAGGEESADEADAEAPEATLRDRLDAIADTVGELNVDDVAVDTFREVVVVEKLGKQYAIDTDGTVDADDLLAGKLEDALDESGEVGE